MKKETNLFCNKTNSMLSRKTQIFVVRLLYFALAIISLSFSFVTMQLMRGTLMDALHSFIAFRILRTELKGMPIARQITVPIIFYLSVIVGFMLCAQNATRIPITSDSILIAIISVAMSVEEIVSAEHKAEEVIRNSNGI